MTNEFIDKIKKKLKKETISESDFLDVMTYFNDEIFKYPSKSLKQLCFRRESAWYEYYIPDKLTIRCYANIKFPVVLERFSKNMKDGSFEWGILFCQDGIWLLNSDIPVCNTEFTSKKIVLKVLFNNKSDWAYLDYLSYENLLGNDKKTYYFRDIIAYKNTCFSSDKYKSWDHYNSSLKRFLSYYASIVGEYNTDYYNLIRPYNFITFIKQKCGIKSAHSIKNQFFYIKDFMVNWAHNKEFDISSKDIVAMCEEILNEPSAKKNETDVEKIVRIIRYLENGRSGLRNKTMFLLILCFGMERRKVCALTWSDIDEECKRINIGTHMIVMPHLLQESMQRLKQHRHKDDIYVFGTLGTRCMKPLSEDVVNSMLASIKNINMQDEFYSNYSSSYMRKWLFRYLLEQKVPLQDIIKLMSISISNIQNFIKDDELWGYTTDGLDNGNKHMLDGFMMEVEERYKR